MEKPFKIRYQLAISISRFILMNLRINGSVGCLVRKLEGRNNLIV